jgi:chemotaxis protein histidine kinase CheA
MNGLTANYNNYSAAELEKALQSWVEPYPKPIILNHDLNSEPMGRVIAARMDKETDGAPFVRLQIAITDPVAAQKVLDKRYLTGSVGGRAGKAVCSITGEDLATESSDGRPRIPKYKRGQIYKGKLAYIDMQEISFKEYSFVNQPADQRSSIRSSKTIDGSSPINDSDQWIAKSNAFVLHMDTEDIVSVQENESILKKLKKKESKPVYLHLKGAFLTALAFEESEKCNNNDSSLLSNEDSITDNSEETHKMDDVKENEDILAVAEGLSEDLSNIAASSTETVEESETTEVSEDTAAKEEQEPEEEVAAPENSDDDSEKADEQAEAAVESEEAEEPKESSDEETKSDAQSQENTEQADELNAEKIDDVEQDTAQLEIKLKSLEEENARLKAALHKTLVERVVDTKIGLGLESAEERENLIESHLKRTASSLADSMRDLAKLPAASNRSVSVPTIESELAISNEENVVTLDAEESQKVENKEDAFEKLFVDALMGRRKL